MHSPATVGAEHPDPDRSGSVVRTSSEVPADAKGAIARIQHVAEVAANAARRLVEKMPAAWPRPSDPEELMQVVERMLLTPRKYGVFVTRPEVRAIRRVHALNRMVNAAKAAEGDGTLD